MIRFRDPDSFAVIEPRIRHVQRELERILALVDLEMDGRPVAVNGFRLRELEPWRSYTTNTAMNALTPISGVCNSKCVFCFEEGIPLPREQSLMPVAEARTRLKYYSPEDGRCLFPSNRPHMETFIHPQAVEIIEMARAREPEKLFWITSNGSHFEERTVARLAKLKPIIFKLSLNVVDETLNRELMKTGRRTPIALEAPKLLRKYEVPFMGSIVAWPTLPLTAIEDTVRYLESLEAYAVRIRLPLSHRWLHDQSDADFYARWQEVSELARRLRPQCRVPLFVEPPIYWVNAIVPEVDGVVLHSPAWRAGVKAGDVIRAIDGARVQTRMESEGLLDQAHIDGRPVDLLVERDGELHGFHLEHLTDGEDRYPYNSRYFYRGENYGIFHVEDFRLRYIDEMFQRIEHYGARNVLLFSSKIVAPIFEALVNGIPAFAERLAGVNLYIETVEENTAGGNYDVMDSRFVDDYARIIRARLDQGLPLDLILIPDAFGSPWGMDMGGRSCAEIEQETGIPVERIDWLLVYGREV